MCHIQHPQSRASEALDASRQEKCPSEIWRKTCELWLVVDEVFIGIKFSRQLMHFFLYCRKNVSVNFYGRQTPSHLHVCIVLNMHDIRKTVANLLIFNSSRTGTGIRQES